MFTVVTDTSANLPSSLVRAYDLYVIPFSYYIDGKEYTQPDPDAFDGVTFFNQIRNGMKVSTSLINVQSYLDHFEPLAAAGQDILFVSMSSGVSGSYSAATLAAQTVMEDYPSCHIRTVDTLGASLGEGFLALEAVKLRDQGKTLDETADALEQLRWRMCQVFTVDDLMHLKRTGRLSGAKATLGTVLNIKPTLKGNMEGKIVQIGQVRGRKKSLLELARVYNQYVVDPENQTVGIAHAGCPEDAVFLINELNKTKPPKDILTVMYEPVTGSHVGPSTLALFFYGNPEFRL